MGVPALLVDFPHPTSPNHAAAARHLGKQWPVFWKVGNVFFRPISTLGVLGYSYAGYCAYRAATRTGVILGSDRLEGGASSGPDWKLFAVGAVCHLVTVVHSAVNMQPLNAKIDALRGDTVGVRVDSSLAEWYARRWQKLNLVRLVMPLVAGSLALWQGLKGRFSSY